MSARDGSGLSRRLDRPVVLVGLMGAGKSTVGRRLARRLGLPFVDSDAAIEDAAGLTAGEVFERYGEADFRDGERRLVARLLDGGVRIIATGGGAYVNAQTRRLLNEKAITIWLDAPTDLLAERTARRPETRPLLNKGDRAEILQSLIEQRRPNYAEAHIRVVSQGGSHSDVVETIIAEMNRFLDAR
ncbi:shikimate kinase [Sphingomonas sp. BN140010]|uniref:Shikimate kinase n=1 Tax=Sphingomonas arvum TaxID=2992113 RepID=A0ABT3JCM7_9SPHN|nr:shikimate kinase [Sphingomonas sp. BN140010]MCW3796817.1 shikimate kinase [Sphingomonas sp. BN140010]